MNDGANIVRRSNVEQVLRLAEPSFNALAKIHGTVEFRREASFALQALNGNEYLMKNAMADTDSFKRAIVNVAAIGLSLNPVLRLAYLIPRKGKVCLDISYIGLIALAVDCGSIKWAIPEIVKEKDSFIFKGIGNRPEHNFDPFSDRGPIKGAYCIAKTNQDELIVTIMGIDEIHKIRERSESYKSGKNSAWHSDYEEMVRKTLIRRASKLWPKTSTERNFKEKDLEELLNETDPIILSDPIIDTGKRSEQIITIKDALMELNIDENYYLTENLPKIVRRKIDKFEDLTDLEMDQIIVQLSQLIDIRKKAIK